MAKIIKISKTGLDLIKQHEGFCSEPYLCPASVGTIGYGSTYYEDGTKVKLGDPPITQERAEKLLASVLVQYEKAVDSFARDDITQEQFDALVCFAYNVGIGALKTSTLLRKVNTNPSDPTIKDEFLRWNKAAGKVLKGLTKRREEEAKLYFS